MFEYPKNLTIEPFPNPAPKDGDRWVVIDQSMVPTSGSIMQFVYFGAVLAHEADHWHRGSSEAEAWRINAAVRAAADRAAHKKISACCVDGDWWMKRELDLFACMCGIIPTKRDRL